MARRSTRNCKEKPNGTRFVTVVGDNFFGTITTAWNGAVLPFKVYDNNKIMFMLPSAAASTGDVVVTNGGGSASFTIN
jgi:hypothetical protein